MLCANKTANSTQSLVARIMHSVSYKELDFKMSTSEEASFCYVTNKLIPLLIADNVASSVQSIGCCQK